jgi:cell division protein ZapA (FtsZ GTPase activity inhibitor)
MPRPEAVRVTIFNQSYSLVASGEESERVVELAQKVDDLMHSIASKGGNIDGTRIAVLACLHMADQLQTAQDDLSKIRQDVSTKAREFSMLLDEAIGDEGPAGTSQEPGE